MTVDRVGLCPGDGLSVGPVGLLGVCLRLRVFVGFGRCWVGVGFMLREVRGLRSCRS